MGADAHVDAVEPLAAALPIGDGVCHKGLRGRHRAVDYSRSIRPCTSTAPTTSARSTVPSWPRWAIRTTGEPPRRCAAASPTPARWSAGRWRNRAGLAAGSGAAPGGRRVGLSRTRPASRRRRPCTPSPCRRRSRPAADVMADSHGVIATLRRSSCRPARPRRRRLRACGSCRGQARRHRTRARPRRSRVGAGGHRGVVVARGSAVAEHRGGAWRHSPVCRSSQGGSWSAAAWGAEASRRDRRSSTTSGVPATTAAAPKSSCHDGFVPVSRRLKSAAQST